MGGWSDTARHSSPRGMPPARVRIVADSAADILPSHAHAIGIMVVPNRIVLDGATLRDGVDITPAQFYAHLPRARSNPYTRPASAEDFYLAYQAAFSRGATGILSIHVSSRLSEVVRHAVAARDALAPAPIVVVDSLRAGIGMWPAIIAAARLAGVGAPIQEIYNAASSILARTRMFFMVESLEHLRRSGRIGRAGQLLGSLLDAHPILTIQDGVVTPVETVRPRGRALLRLRELALEVGPIESLLICATSIEAIAQVEALLAERYEGVIQKTWLGATLGVNTGPTVAVAVVVR